MATRTQLVEELLQLPIEDRALAARDLLHSLDEEDDPAQVEASWRDEIEHRIREIEEGTVEPKDGPTVMREARARLRARRDKPQPWLGGATASTPPPTRS